MEVTGSFGTDTGRKRDANEDAFLSNDWMRLYLVADGMGGHSSGEVASQTTVDVIKASMERAKKSGRLEKEPVECFVDSIRLANTAVWEIGTNSPQCKGMGTTIAGVVVIDDESFLAAHVGDSRVYRVRGEEMEQITRDHSLVEEQIALGYLKREDARTSNVKNVITRALGLGEEVDIETHVHDIEDRDMVLLCSDGLTDMVEDKEILETILEEAKNGTPKNAVNGLIELANLAGGKDNITALLLEFRA